MFLFFFSSRRRHTRSLRDWSSDVCSSDLRQGFLRAEITLAAEVVGSEVEFERELFGSDFQDFDGFARHFRPGAVAADDRSEERRVGKECRSRGSWHCYKIKMSVGGREIHG